MTVDVLAVADPVDSYRTRVVINIIEDAVFAIPNPIATGSYWLCAMRPRVRRESVNCRANATKNFAVALESL